MSKVLIGTIGYHNLRNHSVGPVLLQHLQNQVSTAETDIEEMNWGPIAIVQKFQAMQTPYEKVILLGAVQREGRKIGDIDVFRWVGTLPSEQMIQRCIGDAVTGVISVQNLLVIGEYFKIWPHDTLLVDVEPGIEQAGPELTEEMQVAVPEIIQTIKNLINKDSNDFATFNLLYGKSMFNE